MRKIIILWLAAIFALAPMAFAAETVPVDTGEVEGQLVSSHDVVAPGQSFHVAVSTVLNEGWHTYWRNPGDSGEPFDVRFDDTDHLSFGEIIWPLPKPVPTGPIINYGFEGSPLFPVPVTLSETAKAGETVTISGMAYYLVCKDICIPEQFDFVLDIVVGDPVLDNRWSANINRAIKAAPQRVDWPAHGRVKGDRVEIEVQAGQAINGAYFYPNDAGITRHSEAQNNLAAQNGAKLSIANSFATTSALQGPVEGVLGLDRVVDGKTIHDGVILTVTPAAPLDVGAVIAAPSAQGSSGGSSITFWGAILGGVLGGLILNIMPCVFPIISMKALGFVSHAHEPATIRKEGWLYTLGVFATFAVLIFILIALKAAGAQIGWGFQLQSSWLVGLLAILVFAIGLNLLGLFEVGGGLQNIGGDLVAKGGNMGAFFTGALAVIVATPCTAPVMAGAIGYALAQPAFVMAAVFFALALGFALPFLALSYSPALLRMLPKPGPWMDTFKQALAFPMFAAAIWLVYVINGQASQRGVTLVLFAMLLMAFALWAFKRKKLGKILGFVALLGALILPFRIAVEIPSLNKEAWSAQRVAQLQAEGRPVFVDFTADWCVTCKLNELTTLKNKKVIAAFAESNTAFLVADWTNRDAIIAQELKKYDRAGVPLYLYFPPKGSEDYNADRGAILPQTLRVNMLVDILSEK